MEVWTCRAMLVSIHIQAVFLIHPSLIHKHLDRDTVLYSALQKYIAITHRLKLSSKGYSFHSDVSSREATQRLSSWIVSYRFLVTEILCIYIPEATSRFNIATFFSTQPTEPRFFLFAWVSPEFCSYWAHHSISSVNTEPDSRSSSFHHVSRSFGFSTEISLDCKQFANAKRSSSSKHSPLNN